MAPMASQTPITQNYRQPTVDSSMLGTPAFQSTLPLRREDMEARDDQDDDHDSEADFDVEDYSIDLGKLEDRETGTLPNRPRQPKPSLPSEVGGPEDFTLHLRDYIKGVFPQKLEQQVQGKAKERKDRLDVPAEEEGSPLEHRRQGGDKDQHEEPIGDDGNNLDQASEQSDRQQRSENPDTYHLSVMPPMSRHNTEGRLDEAATEIFERISALQAEIEQLRVESEQTRASNQSLREQYSTVKDERSVLRGELCQVKAQVQEANMRESRAHERIMALEKERINTEANELEMLQRRNEDLLSEVASTKTEARIQKEILSDQIVQLKKEAHAAEDLASRSKLPEVPSNKSDTVDHKDEDHGIEGAVNDLRSQIHSLEADLAGTRNELDGATSQLRETRGWASDLEEENQRLIQQNQGLKSDKDEIADILEQKAGLLSTAQDVIAELRARAEHISEETPSPPTSRFRELQEEAVAQADAEHEDTIRALEQKHAAEVKSLESTIRKKGRNMQQREARLAEKQATKVCVLENQVTTLRAQIAQFKIGMPMTSQEKRRDDASSHEDKTSQPRPAFDTLDSLRTTNAALEESIAGLQAEIKSLRIENRNLVEQLALDKEDYKAINRDFDAQMLAWMRERDVRCKVKIQKLKDENELMGKTLMMMWGREECGPGPGADRDIIPQPHALEKQRYKYKFRGNAKEIEA